MYVDHVPRELAVLNTFEVICVQRAKCFQTVTRLGSVGKGAPVSDRLKATKGQVLYYPLPLEETIRQLEEAAGDAPGMHIIINSLATRNRRIWSRIIDLGKVKAALLWLKENNWLYANVDSDVWMKNVATFLADPNLEIEDDTQDDDVPEDVARVCEDLAVRGALLKPMLKKVKEGGDAIPEEDSEARTLLEPCTIHPLESRLPKDAHLKVYQMQRIEGEKLKNKYQHIDLASFPVLYPRGQFGEDHARTISVSSAEFVKNRLMHKDYRFRYDHQYIFSRLWDQELRQVAQGVNQTLRNRKRYNDVNVKDFLDMADKFDDQLEYNVSMIFQQLRGSPQYWRNVRNELLCMLRELGPPTWFVTLSANEYNWESMESMLKTMNAHLPNVDNMRTSALCALDPVMAQEHFHHRFASFFNEVILYHKDGQGGPLGLYQQRGAPHYHILLWVNGAPKKGKDSDEKVAKFIQQHATCRMPDPETEPLLHHNVKTYQSHGCNNYCMRKFRSGKGKGVKAVCRFGFPRPIRKKFLFRDVLRSIALRSRGKLKKRFYELRRQPHERRINDYNETVSLLWSGNIDVQYIGEETAALASYVCGYVTKRESTHTDLWQEIDENKPIHHQLYAYSFQKLKNRECGIIEAIDRLRSQCLYQKTRRTIYINARKPSERTVCLRPYAELRQIAEHNAESTDKYAQNWIDDYYPNRPCVLEDWCYYNVRKYYEKVNDTKKELRFLNSKAGVKEVNDPFLISHTIFKRDDELEKYQYSLLVMFKPFRSEQEELLDKNGHCGEIFQHELETNPLLAEYHNKLKKQFAELEVQREAAQRAAEMPDTPGSGSVDSLGVGPRFDDVVDELMQGLGVPTSQETNLQEDIERMNPDQLELFTKVKDELLQESSQFKMFLSGAGGTGKSFLIHTIRKFMQERFGHGPQRVCIIICAPTGLAAFAIGGQTCHRIFRLPIQHGSRQAFYPLGHHEQKALETVMKDTKLIVVDEISMVSSQVLLYMYKRMEEITRCSDRFGGRCLLAVGDLAQLPPVNAPFVFEPVPANIVQNGLGLGCVNLWLEEFTQYMELTINERQKEDNQYAAILNALRFGQLTEEHVDTLFTRLIRLDETNQKSMMECIVKKFFELQKEDPEVMMLLPRVKMVDQMNGALLNSLDKEIIALPAMKKIHGCTSAAELQKRLKQLEKRATNITTTAGVEMRLEVAIGCRAMLRKNVNVVSGLVNGAIGTLVDVVRDMDGAVLGLKIKFDKISDPQTIQRYSALFNLTSKIVVILEQFPVILSFASTIHKAQGLSLKTLMLDAGSKIFCPGMTYVGLSRVRTLEGLHLINLDPREAKANLSCVNEINRLRSLYRKGIPLESTELKTPKTRADRMWYSAMSRKEMAMDPGAGCQDECDEMDLEHDGDKSSSKSKSKSRKGHKRGKTIGNNARNANGDNQQQHVPVLARRFGIQIKETEKQVRKKRQWKNAAKEISKSRAHASVREWSVRGPGGLGHFHNVRVGVERAPLMPRFQNDERVICYANSAAHLLFACDTFRAFMGQAFQRNLPSLATILEAYEMQQSAGVFEYVLSMEPVRRAFGNFFHAGMQQDCSEFIFKILDRLELLDIFRLQVERRPCRTEECLGHNADIDRLYLPTLWLHVIPKPDYSLGQLIQDSLVPCNVICNVCGARSREEVVDFSTAPDFLLVQLIRHTEAGYYGGPVTTAEVLRIGETAYELICVVLHFGATMTSGHYLAQVRCGRQWITCNDEITGVMTEFPRNLENAYLVLLKRLQGVPSPETVQRSPLRLHGATASDTEESDRQEPDYKGASDTEMFEERKSFTPQKPDRRFKMGAKVKRKFRRSDENSVFQQEARRFKGEGGHHVQEEATVEIIWPVFLAENGDLSYASAGMHLILACGPMREHLLEANFESVIPELSEIVRGYISFRNSRRRAKLDLRNIVAMLEKKARTKFNDPMGFIEAIVKVYRMEREHGIPHKQLCKNFMCALNGIQHTEKRYFSVKIDPSEHRNPFAWYRSWINAKWRDCVDCHLATEVKALLDEELPFLLIEIDRRQFGKFRDDLIPEVDSQEFWLGRNEYKIVAMVEVIPVDLRTFHYAAHILTDMGWLRCVDGGVRVSEFPVGLKGVELILIQKECV